MAMRLDRRGILKCLGLGALGVLAPNNHAWCGDVVEGYLSNVKILEFTFSGINVNSLGYRQGPILSSELEKRVTEFLKNETAKDPILSGIIVREPFPAKPWTPGVLELGLKVVVDKVDADIYVAAINSTYKRIELLNRDRPKDNPEPLNSSDFRWTSETSMPTPFLLDRDHATNPVRLAATVFEKYKVQLARDLKRISQIKSIYE
jgi:hypothetical protein